MSYFNTGRVIISHKCFRIVSCDLAIVFAICLQNVSYAQQQDLTFDEIKSAAKQRAAAIEKYETQVDNAVQELKDSPGFEEFAKDRLTYLSAIWRSQAVQHDNAKEAFYRTLMKETEEKVQKQIEENTELQRLVRLNKVREQITSEFATADRQLTRMKNMPDELSRIDKQIITLSSASQQTDLQIKNAIVKNEKVKDSKKKQKNAEMIKKAEGLSVKTKQKIKELITIRSNLEHAILQLTGSDNFANSQKVLKQRQSEINDYLNQYERKLQEVNGKLDALIFVSNSPKLEEVHGAAQVVRNGNTVSAREATLLQPGDEIKTGKNSSVAYKLEDGSKVKVGSSTTVEVEKTTREIKVKVGVFRFQSKFHYVFSKTKAWIKKATSRRFRVRTPSGGGAVRGTEFIMQVDDDGTTHIFLLKGELDFTLKSGKVQKMTGGVYFSIPKDAKSGQSRNISEEEYFETVERLLPR